MYIYFTNITMLSGLGSNCHQSKVFVLAQQSSSAGNRGVAGSRVQQCGSVGWRFPVSQETSSSKAPHRIWAISSEPSDSKIHRNPFSAEGHIWGILSVFWDKTCTVMTLSSLLHVATMIEWTNRWDCAHTVPAKTKERRESDSSRNNLEFCANKDSLEEVWLFCSGCCTVTLTSCRSVLLCETDTVALWVELLCVNSQLCPERLSQLTSRHNHIWERFPPLMVVLKVN